MKTIKALKEEREQLVAKMQAIVDIATTENRDTTAEENAEIDSISAKGGKIDGIESQINRLQAVEDRAKQILHNRSENRQLEHHIENEAKNVVVPQSERGYKSKFYQKPEDAYTAGHWAAATIFKNDKSRKWLDKHGMEVYGAHTTGTNESAGFLIPSVLENTVISHFENFGVFAANVGMLKPMSGGRWSGPKERDQVTVSYPGEETAATDQTNPKVSLVQLAAREAVALIKVSRALNEDAISALGDMVTRSIARGFANAQDEAGFNGDGTSTYGGMKGLKNALLAGCDVTATGLTTFGALTMANFTAVVGRLPDWSGMQPKWYISKPGYYASMAALQVAGGGNTVADLGNGPVLQFLGYPVVFANVLPKALTTLTTQRVAYFGDLSYAAAMGVARGLTVDTSTERYFEERMLGILATQRYDLNVYEIGTASEAGGMIALKMG